MRKIALVVAAVVTILAAFVGLSVPATAEQAYERVSLKRPIIFLHGIVPPTMGGDDCAARFDPVVEKIRQMYREFYGVNDTYGPSSTWKYPRVSFYAGDTNCNTSIDRYGRHDHHWGMGHKTAPDGRVSHTRDTPIEHLAYHLAWFIKWHYPNIPVDIVATSMGGVIARYMIQTIQSGIHPEFPTGVEVEDVVTFGTPHAGSWMADYCPTSDTQCEQLSPGSYFMDYLAARPQTARGTDWTVFGSVSDWVVGEQSAVAMDAQHKRIYTDGGSAPGHNGFTYMTSDTLDAWSNYDNGAGWTIWNNAPHAVRWGVMGLRDDIR